MNSVILIKRVVGTIPDSKIKRFVISNGKKVYKRTLRNRLTLPLLEKYIISQITEINRNPNSEIGVLVLDLERFWASEIERLGEKVQLYELPSGCRNFLYSLFFTSEETSMLRQYKVTEGFKAKERQFLLFLRVLIPRLASRVGFDCIITCNYIYVQNKLIAKACKSTQIPFLDLNRESKQDVRLNERFKMKYRKLKWHTDFFGNAICVYNENMKRLLCELKVCPPEDIHIVGALRNDFLINKARQLKQNRDCKQVTLFSFRHSPIGTDGIGYESFFSPDGSKGFVKLFDAVHSAIAELASKNPEVKFVIKTKWLKGWQDYITKSIEQYGFSLNNLNNLVIVGPQEDAIEHILKSSVVIGLNSMTLVQSRLAHKVTIIPYFEEIVDKYPDTLQYRDDLSEFILAESRENLIQLVEKYIELPVSLPSSQGVFDKYVGFTDGKNLDRVMSVLLEQCDNALKPRNSVE